MALTFRMLPVGGATQTGNIGEGAGSPILRSYTAAPGSVLDVVGDASGDASSLSSQGFIPVMLSGPTSSRPLFASTTIGTAAHGTLYLDTTLSAVIAYDGVNWRNVITAASV
jgi:hypothetical protein